jgi:protein-tyrosine phosphatase
MNLLFVCSRNQWRSPTAEEIFKNSQEHQVKSAGTEPSARIKLTEKQINWADIIFVMEKKHKDRIEQRFAAVVDEKELIVLDSPDDYQFMDEELVDLIKLSVSAYL